MSNKTIDTWKIDIENRHEGKRYLFTRYANGKVSETYPSVGENKAQVWASCIISGIVPARHLETFEEDNKKWKENIKRIEETKAIVRKIRIEGSLESPGLENHLPKTDFSDTETSSDPILSQRCENYLENHRDNSVLNEPKTSLLARLFSFVKRLYALSKT